MAMLIGARTRDEMTDAQRHVYDVIASGPRRDVPWPFLAMLDAPALADAIQSVGSVLRFSADIAADLREVTILAVSGAFGSGYEWDYHVAIARDLDLPETTIAASVSGDVDGVDETHANIILLCRAAILERQIDQGLLASLVPRIGRKSASEVVAMCGYYQMLALFLSAGELDHPVAGE